MRLLKLFTLATVISLTSCMNMATTSAEAVYNHRSIQKNISDQYITMRAYRALDIDSPLFKNTNISVVTLNHEVLLTGQVPEAWQKPEATRVIKSIPGIVHLYNLLTVGPPTSRSVKLKDTWITAKIKSQFLTSNQVDASQIKVITEDGVVYLMGIIPPSEAIPAVDIARHTEGVRSVVKVFSYVRISKRFEE